jgi:hypothetical protein
MNVTDYFQEFRGNEYVLFNRDPNGQFGMELAFLDGINRTKTNYLMAINENTCIILVASTYTEFGRKFLVVKYYILLLLQCTLF